MFQIVSIKTAVWSSKFSFPSKDNKKDSVAAAKSATRAELRELVDEDERTSFVDDKQNTLEERNVEVSVWMI